MLVLGSMAGEFARVLCIQPKAWWDMRDRVEGRRQRVRRKRMRRGMESRKRGRGQGRGGERDPELFLLLGWFKSSHFPSLFLPIPSPPLSFSFISLHSSCPHRPNAWQIIQFFDFKSVASSYTSPPVSLFACLFFMLCRLPPTLPLHLCLLK